MSIKSLSSICNFLIDFISLFINNHEIHENLLSYVLSNKIVFCSFYLILKTICTTACNHCLLLVAISLSPPCFFDWFMSIFTNCNSKKQKCKKQITYLNRIIILFNHYLFKKNITRLDIYSIYTHI